MASREWINYWAPRVHEADQDDEHPLLPTVACTFPGWHARIGGDDPIYCWGRCRRNLKRVWATSNLTTGVGPNLVTGRRGLAARFDGSNDVLQFAADDNYAGIGASNVVQASAKSLLVEIVPTGAPVSAANTYGLDMIIGEAGGFFGLFRGDLTVDQGGGTGDRIWAYNWDGDEASTGATYAVDRSIMVGYTHDGTTLRVFKGGDLMGSVASGPTTDISAALVAGKIGTLYLQADINLLYVFDRVLSPSQMRYLSQYPYCWVLEKEATRFFAPSAAPSDTPIRPRTAIKHGAVI